MRCSTPREEGKLVSWCCVSPMCPHTDPYPSSSKESPCAGQRRVWGHTHCSGSIPLSHHEPTERRGKASSASRVLHNACHSLHTAHHSPGEVKLPRHSEICFIAITVLACKPRMCGAGPAASHHNPKHSNSSTLQGNFQSTQCHPSPSPAYSPHQSTPQSS